MVWTQEEIAQYHPLPDLGLVSLYHKEKTSRDPESRTKFLEKYLNLTLADKSRVETTRTEKGEASALNLLERFATSTAYNPN